MHDFVDRRFQEKNRPSAISISLPNWKKLLWSALFLLPFVLWNLTSDVLNYFRYGAPTGQIWYVFSKLFGLYAAVLLWYQAISTLLKNTSYTNLLRQWTFLRHRILGSLTLLAVIMHIVCFVTAVSLRKGTIAWGLLLPDFRDFYHIAITIGLTGFIISLVAIAAVVFKRRLPKVWRVIHRGMIMVVILGLIHGYLIGTETRYGLYEVFYCTLILSLFFAIGLRWQLQGKKI